MKVIGTVISLLLTIPPDITTVADITPDDSDPLIRKFILQISTFLYYTTPNIHSYIILLAKCYM